MTVEGAVAHRRRRCRVVSIALIGFGLDSAIEGFASLVIVWRFTGAPDVLHDAETKRRRSSWPSSSSSSRPTSASSP
ncbi:MAG: hypothetical protein WKF40_00025 [Thermoleophilaceae bacterium]